MNRRFFQPRSGWRQLLETPREHWPATARHPQAGTGMPSETHQGSLALPWHLNPRCHLHICHNGSKAAEHVYLKIALFGPRTGSFVLSDKAFQFALLTQSFRENQHVLSGMTSADTYHSSQDICLSSSSSSSSLGLPVIASEIADTSEAAPSLPSFGQLCANFVRSARQVPRQGQVTVSRKYFWHVAFSTTFMRHCNKSRATLPPNVRSSSSRMVKMVSIKPCTVTMVLSLSMYFSKSRLLDR